jgi:hypothetical protein
MSYISIPYVASNNSIDKETVINTIKFLEISEDAKYKTFEAIYNACPAGVSFNALDEALLLGRALRRLGIPHRHSE